MSKPGWDQSPSQPPPVTVVNNITLSSSSSATAVASARSGGGPRTGCFGCLAMLLLLPILFCGGCLMIGAMGTAGDAARRAEAEAAAKKNQPPIATVKAKETRPAATSEFSSETLDPIKLDEPVVSSAVPTEEKPERAPTRLPETAPEPLKDLPLRDWTSTSGYSTRACLLSCTGGTVTLKKKDGTLAELPLDQLSEADQKYVKLSSRYER